MLRSARVVTLALALPFTALLGAGRAMADPYCATPAVSYYYTPAVSYYAPAPQVSSYTPAVSYYAPAVSYYAPAVSYYTPAVSYYAPAVSYYAPSVSYYTAPGAVSTTRYGLFGRPRRTTTYYYGW